jgi:hypothetical protein
MINVSISATDQKPVAPANPGPASTPQQQTQGNPKPADDKSGGQQK